MSSPAADNPARHHWKIWQLLDSAFPTGGFAHSGGVEAAWQHGLIRDGDGLLEFTRSALRQCAAGTVPVVVAVVRAPSGFAAIDTFYDVCVSNHVANRASRAQGRALLATASSTFGVAGLTEVVEQIRRDRLPGHLPAAFGLVAGGLGLDSAAAASGFLFMTARGMLSAAVRLGAVGPLEGQRIQAAIAADAEPLARQVLDRDLQDLTQTTPMLDLLQATQDRLYSRLFQS